MDKKKEALKKAIKDFRAIKSDYLADCLERILNKIELEEEATTLDAPMPLKIDKGVA